MRGVVDVVVGAGQRAGEEYLVQIVGVAVIHEVQEGSEGGRVGNIQWENGDLESLCDLAARQDSNLGPPVIAAGHHGELGAVRSEDDLVGREEGVVVFRRGSNCIVSEERTAADSEHMCRRG